MTAIRVVLLTMSCAAWIGAQKQVADASYFREIVPIIQRNCQGCHQPAMKSGGLDLTRYDSFAAGGNRGPAFKAGSPQESIVVAYLKGEKQPRMPFGLPALSEDQIDFFRRWIAEGAKDDTPTEARESTEAGQHPVYHLPPVITSLAYSPDGSLLAISGYREVVLHKSDGSGIVDRLGGISDRIQSLQFSRDGKLLVAAGGTEVLQLDRWGSDRVSGWGLAGLLCSTSVSSPPRLSLPASVGISASH